MQIGMIGLGRMGANMVRRLMQSGHECVVYDLSPEAVAQLAAEGAVGAASLEELVKDGELAGFSGRVSDSGEGRWTIQAAIEAGVPAHVLTASVFERFSSRGEAEFANKVLSAMRYEFGDHEEAAEDE